MLIDSNVVRFDPRYISGATLYTTDISVALIFSDLSTYQPPGSDVPLGEAEDAVARGESDSSLRTVDGQRVLAQRTHDGSTLVIGQRLAPTVAVLDRLAWVLFVVGGCGVILAAVAGTTVGRTGLRPIARLTAATERVARTDDLTQIPVTGSDELARLTESFNTMLRALAESRERQSRLVADAGHELRDAVDFVAHQHGIADRVKSPSVRRRFPTRTWQNFVPTSSRRSRNCRLWSATSSTWPVKTHPKPCTSASTSSDVVERALERARRRRNEIEFEAVTTPWYRLRRSSGPVACRWLNVLDNAAKWSPKGEQVRVEMRPVGQGLLELTVSDAGPGIPEEDRELVFDRFYRSTAARSMPGSGLGLAIVRQVVVKHGGTIAIDESDRGGALVRIVLPGEPGPSAE